LPPNISHDQLIATMRFFARSLGVKCNHCHVVNPAGSKEEFDFPADAKPEKNAARTMIRMANQINGDFISRLNRQAETVTCFTCHRGHTIPESAPPAETAAPRT